MRAMDTAQKVLILGGGISGLTFAWHCQQAGIPFELIERDHRFGGNIHTLDTEKGPLEMGAHAFYNSYLHCIELLKSLDLAESVYRKPRLPYRIKQDSFYVNILKVLSLPEACKTLLFHSKSQSPLETIEQKFTRLLGSGNYQKVLRPFFNALLNQDADSFPAALVMKRRKRCRSWPRIFSLRGGMNTLTEALANRLKSTHCDFQIADISTSPAGYTLTSMDGRKIAGRTLVIATSVKQAEHILTQIKSPLASLLKRTQEAASQAVAIKTGPLSMPPLAGTIVEGELYRSFITNDTRDKTPSPRTFTFHFRKLSGADSLYQDCASEALQCPEDHPAVVLSKKLNTMPQLTIEAYQDILDLMEKLPKHPHLYITGNYFYGVSLEDCLARSQEEFSRLQNTVKIQTSR